MAQQGRVFIIRLEDGEVIHEILERFARDQSIRAATLIAVGGADRGSALVVGPEDGRASPVVPMECVLSDVHEIVGVGTIFPDEKGHPIVHLHMASGRASSTVTGCVRRGVKVWQVIEIVLIELVNCTGVRVLDLTTGFALLSP